MSAKRVPAAVGVLATVGAAIVVVPIIGLLAKTHWSGLVDALSGPAVADALGLSLVTSAITTFVAVAVGVPLAVVLARATVPGLRVLRALVTIPLALPPVAGGVALLLTFGRRGLVGAWLDEGLGLTVPFTTAAVVLAQLFVSLPFVVAATEAGIRALDGRHEDAAATLGARPGRVLWRVTLPMALPSIGAGAVLCWARALGELGATITFAGNLPGRTQTVPLAMFVQLDQDPDAAVALSVLLLGVSLVVLIALRDRWVPAFGRVRHRAEPTA